MPQRAYAIEDAVDINEHNRAAVMLNELADEVAELSGKVRVISGTGALLRDRARNSHLM